MRRFVYLILLLNTSLVVGEANTSFKNRCQKLRTARAQRNQADFLRLVDKKLAMIQRRFAAEVAILEKSDNQQINLIEPSKVIVTNAYANHWFYPLVGYRDSVLKYARILERFQANQILNDQQLLETNLAVATALQKINRLHNYLQQINKCVLQDQVYINQNKSLAFWSTVAFVLYSSIVAYYLVYASAAFVLMFVTGVMPPIAKAVFWSLSTISVAAVVYTDVKLIRSLKTI